MTLYLDTSALVKLYVVEAGSDDVIQWLSQLDHEEILVQLDQDWRELNTVHVDPALAVAAGALCTGHGLRGFDSIQLASALYARAMATGDFVAATYDPMLARAMRAEGIVVRGAPTRPG